MGIFGSIGKALKGAAKGVGKVAGFVGDTVSKAAPVVGLIPGVGTVAGGLIGAGGGLLGTLNDKDANIGDAFKNTLSGGVKGGLSGLGNAALLGGKGIAGVPGLLGGAKSLLAGGASKIPGAIAGDPMSGEGAVSGGGGLLGSVKDWILKNPGKAAGLGLTAANLISGAKQGGQADATLAAARARLDDPQREDVSGLFASGNPYAANNTLNRARELAQRSLMRSA